MSKSQNVEARGSVNINPNNETPNLKEDIMKLENLSISTLVVNYHPRNMLGDIESLQGSIKRDGLQEPLMVYAIAKNQYAVIDGVRRLEAVKEFGWQSIPCLIKKDMAASDAAHLSYVKNTERNSLNPIEIACHLKAMMDDFGYTQSDLELKGYGSKAKISGVLKLLELPESVQNQIQGGELTAAHGRALAKLKTNKEQERMAKQIIDGDMTAKRADIRIDRYLKKGKSKAAETMQPLPSQDIPGVYIKDSRDMSELPDKSVHMVLSSPPYNIGMEFEKGVPFDEHLAMVKDVLKECARVLVPGGIMALNVDDIINFKGRKGQNDFSQIQLMAHFYQSYLRSHNIRLTDRIIWKKPSAWRKKLHQAYSDELVHTTYRMIDNFEPVYIFRKKGERDLPSESVILRSKLTKEEYIAWVPSVWEIDAVHKMEGHPCIWPDELAHRLIKMFTYEGDTVLDPFLGSGTTVKVAKELNRDGIGYEKEPQYKTVIMERLGLESEAPAEAPAETMAEYAERSLEEDAGSTEAEGSKAAEPAEFRDPDLLDFIRKHEEATEAEENKEAIVIER
jgi:site-specific DNA-methyltransferase (adenine-specific)